jgi:uncharacterized protein YeaO (DUF488 family)
VRVVLCTVGRAFAVGGDDHPPAISYLVTIKVKRAYDPPSKTDGTRILVDRLWPRGLTKAKAQIDLWLKEIAPSTELRKWFHSEGEDADWKEFRRRYLSELKNLQDELELLRNKIHQGPVTLIYSSRNREQNHAVILKKILERGL